MDDSADMKSAGEALDHAVDSLEAALGPILSRLKTLEAEVKGGEAFREDRVKLAAELDAVSADAKEAAARFAAREAEFNRLGRETEDELVRTIGLVQSVIGG